MYVTLEPCSMCAGAIINSRIKKLYIGTMDEKTGAAGSVLDLFSDYAFNHKVEVQKGIMQNECEQILKEFFKKLRELKKKNNLDSNLLKIGQTLIIPETSTYQTYIVKDNDTLDSIANYFNVSKDDIKKANNMLTDDILIGQIMIIPKK